MSTQDLTPEALGLPATEAIAENTALGIFVLAEAIIFLPMFSLSLAVDPAIGFHPGTYFSMAMIGLTGASILYDTSKILKVCPEDRYVAAALELFATIALML